MKVSLNWIRLMNTNYGCSSSSELDDVDKLIEKIGAQLGAVEEVDNLGAKYKGILIVKVVECMKHPDADKLSLCLVDDGGVHKSVERDADGLIQVVCGAPNVKAGQLVAWIPPGATVPSTVDKDPFVIESRDIRGKTSHGMLASPKELALGDNHKGILVLDGGQPGEEFVSKYYLDDHIVDIENKMFTHRPDCFGILGVARELAGISGKAFKSPDWYREEAGLPADGRKNVLKLSVKNDVPDLVPRFCAVAIKDVKVGDSPVWLQSFLSRSGIRPINNIVDITNWFMMVTAQPLHAYDYDKVVDSRQSTVDSGAILGVRLSEKGEKLKLLNGKEITLDGDAVVITDGQKPIGLGGVKGGADTEVDENTKNIILECANFDMNQTRRTAMSYGLFTDAATRFTKNQSPRQNKAVIAKAARDMLELAGGRLASPLIDDKHFKTDDKPIKTTAAFINSRLGTDLSAAQMQKILRNVEFEAGLSGDRLSVTAPFWRTDIEIPEDIVEEVGRLNGYDKLPAVLPKRDLAPAAKEPILEFKSRLRQILKQAGANEVLTYSFVNEKLLKNAGQDPAQAYHIRNAISPDLQYYRLSVTPSLLDKIQPNIRGGFDEFAIFELGKGHNQKMKDDDGLPQEFEMLSLVFAAKAASANDQGAPFYEARKILDYLGSRLGIKLEYRSIEQEEPYPVVKPFEHSRSAQVWAGELPLGMVGEYKQAVARNFKLPSQTAGFEIGITQLMRAAAPIKEYKPLNRFPELEQDFCLRADSKLTYNELTSFMTVGLAELTKESGIEFRLEPIDIFQKTADKNHKQTTWRIILWHPERTLTTEETNKLLDQLARRAQTELKAERI